MMGADPSRQFILPTNVLWKGFSLVRATLRDMSPRSRFRALAFALVFLLLTAGAGIVGAGTVNADDPVAESDTETTMTVKIQNDGDARWTVSTAFSLETQNQTAAFRDLATAFENRDGSVLGLEAFERAAGLASETTDRDMAITDVERNTRLEDSVQNRTGTLRLVFTWEHFARLDGNRIHVDDVIVTDQGLWLSGLDADQTLVVEPPDGYGVVNATVPAQNGELRWAGPVRFDRTSLQATFIGDANGDGDDPGGGNDNNGSTGGPDEPPGSSGNGDSTSSTWLVASGAVLLLAFVLAVFFLGRRGRIAFPQPTTDDSDGDVATEKRADDQPGSDATDRGSGTGGSSANPGIDEELLSDEERVRRLLEANGGRMKQANIVKETDWSNAKVSQLLSSMDEDDEIEKLRLGRENLISFPDEDITDIKDENE
jgi:hypothetical protein